MHKLVMPLLAFGLLNMSCANPPSSPRKQMDQLMRPPAPFVITLPNGAQYRVIPSPRLATIPTYLPGLFERDVRQAVASTFEKDPDVDIGRIAFTYVSMRPPPGEKTLDYGPPMDYYVKDYATVERITE